MRIDRYKTLLDFGVEWGFVFWGWGSNSTLLRSSILPVLMHIGIKYFAYRLFIDITIKALANGQLHTDEKA
ncbi:MAG: hypothetical protein AB8F78_06445 [Saprospiraceae bacterium]